MLKLWGRPTSARTLKVLWALGEIGLDFEFILASATMGPDGSVDKGNAPFGGPPLDRIRDLLGHVHLLGLYWTMSSGWTQLSGEQDNSSNK